MNLTIQDTFNNKSTYSLEALIMVDLGVVLTHQIPV